MAAAVTATRIGLARVGVPNVASLVLQVAVGVLTYALAAFVVARRTSREVWTLLSGVIARRRRRNMTPNPNGEAR